VQLHATSVATEVLPTENLGSDALLECDIGLYISVDTVEGELGVACFSDNYL
jgi:hypothetical protein